MNEMNAEQAREQLYELSYRGWMDFAAWEDGDCRFWANEDGEVIAYCRFDDRDPNGIAFFETRDRGQGIGSRIIRQLQAERPGLYISGDIDNEDCRRFWARMGYDMSGVQVVRE